MDRLTELSELVGYLQTELRAIDAEAGEERALNEDEDQRFNDGVWLRDAAIAEGEQLEQRRAAIAVAVDNGSTESGSDNGPAVHRDVDPYTAEYRSEHGDREAALRAIGDDQWMDEEAKTGAEQRLQSVRGVARHILAHNSPAYKRAFGKILAQPMNFGVMLDPDEAQALRFSLETMGDERAMSLTDASGGFMVPTFLDPSLVDTGSGSSNPFRQISNVRQITGDNYNVNLSTGVTASWDAEAAEVSDDAPTLAQETITPYKGAAFVPISIEANEDIANIAAEIGAMIQVGKDDLEATAFATGTGSAQPFGIAVATVGAAGYTAMATNSAFAVGDLFSAVEALPAKYRQRSPVWVMDQVHINDVMEFGGTSYYTRSATLDAGPSGSILGAPVFEASALSSTLDGDTNNNIVFGDFANGYTIVDRIGLQVEFIPHLFHTTTNRPSGSRGWYAHWRVGADSTNDTSFVLLYNPST